MKRAPKGPAQGLRPRGVRGFTWKEAAVVMVIVAGIAALLGPGLRVDYPPKERVAREECRKRYDAVAASLALLDRDLPTEVADPGTDPRVVLEPDPWGHPYRLVREGPRAFRICSNGPDGQPDTADDIVYPPAASD